MRELTMVEREVIKNVPASEISEDSGYIIEHGKVIGVED